VDRVGRLRPTALAASFLTALLTCATLATPPPAQAAPHEPMINHATLGLGFARHLSDDFKDSGLENGGQGQLAYRYSLNQSVDLCLDMRSMMASDEVTATDESGNPIAVKFESETSYYGPGVRWSSGAGGVRPYLQANVFFVKETGRVELGDISIDASEDGAGFGLMGGADIRLSRLLSLPIEATYLYGKPEVDVSSLGMQVGLTFNFTPL